MGPFKEAVITRIGDVLRNDNLAGEIINFNRMAVGNGEYPEGTDLREITGVQNEFLSTTMPIKRKVDEFTTYIAGVFENKTLEERTPVTEVALHAIHPELGEVCFAYIERDPEGELFTIPSRTQFPGYSVEMRIEVKSINVDSIDITQRLELDPDEIAIDIPQLPQAETLGDIINIILNAITPKFK